MALQKFNLAVLGTIDDGRISEAFAQALARVEHDLRDRAVVKKSRKITITLEMTPVANERGDLESCWVGLDVKDNIPARKTKNYNMAATRGGLMFNELSPEEVRQQTIDDVNGPKPLEKKA